MATQILAIPQTADPLDFETSNTTDWTDSFQIVVAGAAVGYAAAGNIGSGSIVVASVTAHTKIGAHTLRVVEVQSGLVRFIVSDPDDLSTGIGTVGAPAAAGGITFTLSGSGFVVGDGFTLDVVGAPLDLTGIDLDLMARSATVPNPQVALYVTTRVTAAAPTPTIVTGGTDGTIALRAPYAPTMRLLKPDTYRYELVAIADGRRVRVRRGQIVHLQGETPPSF